MYPDTGAGDFWQSQGAGEGCLDPAAGSKTGARANFPGYRLPIPKTSPFLPIPTQTHWDLGH